MIIRSLVLICNKMKKKIADFLFNWIDGFSSQTKTIIIILCILVFMVVFVGQNTKAYIKERFKIEQTEKEKQEMYLEKAAPQINDFVQDIIEKDSLISNILLLNYHNTLTSSNGLAYKYLTAITEKFRGLDNNPCIDDWPELPYVNYIQEIRKIGQTTYTIWEDNDANRINFPNFSYRLRKADAQYAVLYPINGIYENVGMLIVIYKNTKPNINATYYDNVIHHSIVKLAILLDYNTVKETYEN